MVDQKIHFTNDAGQQLVGHLSTPIYGQPRVYALFAHCFTCSKDLKVVHHISRALLQHNIAVFRFDFTGLGESEGDFADTNFSSNVGDLVQAAHYLKENFQAPKILIGHSLGGAAVLLAAQKLPFTEAVVTIGAPADPSHVKENFQAKLSEIENKGHAEVTLAGRTFTIKEQFIKDLEATNLKQATPSLKKPLLLFHSPQDNIVGIDNAKQIYKNALHPKSFISLDGANHLLTNKADSLYVGNVIASWCERYVELGPATQLETDQQVVASIAKEKYVTEIIAGDHHQLADEPTSVGGSNAGPTPYHYLNAALGSCTAMTLRMYADRKSWPLEKVNVHLSHEKLHAKDCDDCETNEGKIDKITRHIEVYGNLDEKQQQRLLEIANKCPVHRTLHNKIKVESKLI